MLVKFRVVNLPTEVTIFFDVLVSWVEDVPVLFGDFSFFVLEEPGASGVITRDGFSFPLGVVRPRVSFFDMKDF